MIRFTLYIAGQSPRSTTAIANLRRLGETLFAGRHEVAVIDVLEQPEAADRDRILTTPTLIKEEPEPRRRVIGDLSDFQKVVAGLAIDVNATESTGGTSI